MRHDDLGLGPRIFVGVLTWAVRALFRIRVEGLQHIPGDGAAIVAANHVSPLDGVLLGVVIWWRRRRATRFLTAAEFFRNPIFGAALRACGQIPIQRGQGDAGAIGRATAAATAGSLVGIFPEGRVNDRPDGPLQRGRTGAARLALAASTPVVPVGIWGTQRRWPRGGPRWTRPFRTVVAFSFGPPASLDGGSAYEDAEAATEVVVRALEAQVAAARTLAER